MRQSDFQQIHGKIARIGSCSDLAIHCGSRAGTASTDGARYSAAPCLIIAFEYHSRIREFRCRTLAKSRPRLGAQGRSTARQRCESGPRCARRDGDPNQRPTVLAVRGCRSHDERILAFTALCDDYNGIDTTISARTSGETRCRRRCVSR